MSRRVSGVCLLIVVFLTAWGGTSPNEPSAPVVSHVVGRPSRQALQAVGDATTRLLASSADVSLAISRAPSLGGTAELSGSFDFERHQGMFSLTPGGTGEQEPLVFHLTSVYIHQTSSAANTKPWLLYNAAENPKIPANLHAPVAQLQALNPAPTLAGLAWGLYSAAPAGTDIVSGVTVRRYVATIDIGQATEYGTSSVELQAAEVALSNELQTMLNANPGVPPWITAVADVDPAGHLVQLQISPPGNVGDLVFTFSNFGRHVAFQRPANDQVTDISGLKPGGETEKQKGADGDAS